MIRRSNDLADNLLDVGYSTKPYEKIFNVTSDISLDFDSPGNREHNACYSSFGLRALLEKNGFVISIHEKLGVNATTLFQLTNAYLFKIIQSWPRSMQHLFTMTVIAMINFAGLVAGRALPANPDLFLDHVVLARKVT